MSESGAPPPRSLLFLVTAPSGSGKDSVLRALRRRKADLHWATTAVTRGPRAGEVEGRDHFFMTPDEFQAARRAAWFLETAEVYGRSYGTPLDQVRQPLEQGRDVVLRLDVQGARTLKARYPQAIVVFIQPPSATEAERRLRVRSTEREDEIERRVRAMHDYELAFASEADYRIPSATDAVETVADHVWAVVTAERLRARPRRVDPQALRPVTSEARRS